MTDPFTVTLTVSTRVLLDARWWFPVAVLLTSVGQRRFLMVSGALPFGEPIGSIDFRTPLGRWSLALRSLTWRVW